MEPEQHSAQRLPYLRNRASTHFQLPSSLESRRMPITLASLASIGHDVFNICGDLIFHNPLATLLTPTGWPSVFGNQQSDAVVPFSSEVNNLTVPTNDQFTGYIHSPGFTRLGFTGPTIVDAGAVPTRVIQLLNTPVTQPEFNLLNP
jgi:hypothetical protein